MKENMSYYSNSTQISFEALKYSPVSKKSLPMRQNIHKNVKKILTISFKKAEIPCAEVFH